MLSETAQDLSFELARISGEETYLVMRTPTADLDARALLRRERHWYVERDHADSAPLEFAPERFVREPFAGNPAQPHRVRVPLHQVMDAVLAGRSRGVKSG